MVAVLFATLIYAQKTTEIKMKDLPKATTDWMKTNLPKATFEKAVKSDDKGTITYGIMVNSSGRKHIYLFDKDGKFLQKGDNLFGRGAAKGDAKVAPKK